MYVCGAGGEIQQQGSIYKMLILRLRGKSVESLHLG